MEGLIRALLDRPEANGDTLLKIQQLIADKLKK
jgi:hypothetical protein